MSRQLLKSALVAAAGCLLPLGAVANTSVEEVTSICSGLQPHEKPVVAVMDFEEKAGQTGIGGGMATMLMNALHGTGCFAVVETERLDEVMAEQRLGLSGAMAQGSAPAVGQMSGAQFLVMGTITEFKEDESGGSIGGRAIKGLFGRRKKLRSVVGNVGWKTAHIGFNIRIVDAATRRVVVSQSFDKKKRDIGLMGATGTWTDALAGLGYKSKALADAFEEGLIEAVEFVAAQRTSMRAAMPQQAQEATLDRNACAALQAGAGPRIMVIVPEEHITGHFGSYGSERNPYGFEEHAAGESSSGSGLPAAGELAARAIIRPPDPAGETEILRKLIEFGFTVVDDKQVETLREQERARFRQVHRNAAIAAEIGRQFDADIVITGEAFSEFSMQMNDMYSCRARVETRAVDVQTGRIIATDGLHGSGLDISEVIAGKTALRNAGSLAADYYIPQICKYAGGGQFSAGVSAPSRATTRIVVRDVDFRTARAVEELVSEMALVRSTKKDYQDGDVMIRVTHSGSTDELADALLESLSSLGIEITGLAGGEISATLTSQVGSSG